MYKIGELSKLTKIPVKTLRYYADEGILSPDKTDKFTGYRYYSPSKLLDCYRILALKELGFSLEEIKRHFSMPTQELSALMNAREQELLKLAAQTEKRINILRELRSAAEEEKSMFDIVIRKSDSMRVAFDRRIISDRSEEGAILAEIRSRLPEEIVGRRTVVIDYETEYSGGSVDTGFGIELKGKLPDGCGFTEKTIIFTDETASLICWENEYEEAVRALGKYIQENDHQIIGAVYKIIYEDNTVELKIPVCRLYPQMQPPRNDNIDMPFVNDERAVGRWQLIDHLPSREQFDPRKPKSVIDSERIREIYFLPRGERYWCFGWTKGYLLSSFGYPQQDGANPYTIENIGGKDYMFIEMKFHHYFLLGGKPEIWVLEKLDSREYIKRDIRITDKIPDAPADDERVLGKWSVCDLVKEISDFSPENPDPRFPYEALFWKTAEFFPDGKMLNSFNVKNGICTDEPHIWRWTTGNVINEIRQTVSMYKIRRYGSREYLFIQWKSGDYVYGGDKPYWYVFIR